MDVLLIRRVYGTAARGEAAQETNKVTTSAYIITIVLECTIIMFNGCPQHTEMVTRVDAGTTEIPPDSC